MSGLSPFLIFTASFVSKKAHWTLAPFDYVCGVLSGLALVLWYVTGDPNVAIAFAIASDGLASIPTFTKAWKHPETEVAWPFMVGVFNASTSFLASAMWAFSGFAVSAYLIIINILLFFSVYKKKLVSLLTKQQNLQTSQI